MAPEEALLVPSLSRMESTESVYFSHEFAQDNPGKLEDFYEVGQRQLGEGAFGSVFKAKCKHTSMERAVKAIDIKSVRNPARLERELSITKKLDHPNVVRVYESFKDAKKIFLVMELCTGGELFDRITQDAPGGFDEQMAATYIRQIIAALCYLHAHKFVHRDVKPENFLLQSPAPDASLKIIDFGLASSFEDGKDLTTRLGTPYYVAPEVLNSAYDEKCDIWSAGVISFILLCGFPPFSGKCDKEILQKVKEGSFEFRSPEWDTVSQGAKDVIKHMLTVDRVLRPRAEELLSMSWLREKGTPKPVAISSNLINRLQSFQAHTKFKKVALTAVAQQLPHEKVEELQETFRDLDKNGDGTLSFDEIKEGLEKHGLTAPSTLEEILRVCDSNGSGSLDYSEFVAASIDQKAYMTRDVMWEAFRTFDLDGDGKITRDELQKVLNGGPVQKTLGAKKIENMIREVDCNGDGCIDFEEFCAMLTGKTALPPPAKRPRVENLIT